MLSLPQNSKIINAKNIISKITLIPQALKELVDFENIFLDVKLAIKTFKHQFLLESSLFINFNKFCQRLGLE
jgi:hypothetical protein